MEMKFPLREQMLKAVKAFISTVGDTVTIGTLGSHPLHLCRFCAVLDLISIQYSHMQSVCGPIAPE